jgi:poly-gamma-glutamate synthesis protein (capsule biosynthesis protein)
VIHGTGDVGLDPSQTPIFRTRGYERAWSGLEGLLRRDDLTVVNLECPVTDVADPVAKAVTFRCDPAALPGARAAGVDVVTQGNNHAFDQGAAGLLDSLARIRAAGIVVVGAGVERDHAIRAATFLREGWRVAVLAVDQIADPPSSVAGATTPGTAFGHDFALVLGAIRAASASSDLVVVAIHWGVEGEERPTALQVRQAHRMIDAGASVIYGSHAHRLQPMETYRGRPIFYGLGNTVWPEIAGSSGGIGEVTVRPDGSIGARILPVEIVGDGHPVLAGV